MHRILLALGAMGLWGQALPEPELVRVGPGVTQPVLVKKVEPAYSAEALEAKISGAVLVEMVVSAEGVPGRIRVLRPLGYGLDEAAVEAVSQWRFVPAKREGVPARMAATIEVRFWPGKVEPNPDEERRRAKYNDALRTLMQKGAAGGGRPDAVRVMQELSAEGYPAAMFAVGLSKLDGPGALAEIARDEAGGVALVEKAAAARFAPALYLLALRRIRGEGGRAMRRKACA
ncbi:MAG: energy transducer TonB [Bryobacterales bacterium]|nr:energy transducer TonB [Bryobacterales bacterium]